jgi:ketol-acid reductoisomerase
MLSGEIERSYRLLRLEGYAGQMRYHSPTSQYGQMSRADRYDGLDVPGVMREVLSEIKSGKFADEWDAEREAGTRTWSACGPRSLAPRSSPSRRTCAPASASAPSPPPADPRAPSLTAYP